MVTVILWSRVICGRANSVVTVERRHKLHNQLDSPAPRSFFPFLLVSNLTLYPLFFVFPLTPSFPRHKTTAGYRRILVISTLAFLTTFFHSPLLAMRLDHLLSRNCVQCPSIPPVCNCGPSQVCVQIAQYVSWLHILRARFLRVLSGAVTNVALLHVKTRKVKPILVMGSAQGWLQVPS
jgi:hypothetical protein